MSPDDGNGWRDWAMIGFVLAVGVVLWWALT